MAHAIGHKAGILPEATRVWALTALSSMQTVCFVTRGKRPFTTAEHNYVYEVVGKRFWKSLARLVAWKEALKAKVGHDSKHAADGRQPRQHPKKRKRVKVFLSRLRELDESSDTVDSDGEDSYGPQHYIRSDKIIPHAFVHLTEQVQLGGTHQFHNTSAVESCHTQCILLAGTRVRKSTANDVTEKSMLGFTLDLQLFDDIADRVLEHDDGTQHVLVVCLAKTY